MLPIDVPISPEGWDEEKQEFVEPKVVTLQLEHSLVSLGKWESKWHKPFLSKREKTFDETIDYIKCMTLTKNVDPKVYDYLTSENFSEVHNYISDPMTATTFPKSSSKESSREQVTAELIHCWMIMLNIPTEFQKWHLNRLLALIRVVEIKSQPPKKGNRRDTASRYASLNAARRQKYNTKG